MKPVLSLDPELSLHVHCSRDSWINFYVFSLAGKCHLICVTEFCFFLLPVLLRYTWHTALYKFKVYSIMIWFIYDMKWLPQKVYWASISSYRYKVKEKEKYFFLVMRTFRIFSLNSFHVNISHTTVLLIPLLSNAYLGPISQKLCIFCHLSSS